MERHAKQMTLERAVIRNGLAQRAKSPISVTLRAVDIFGKNYQVASQDEETVTVPQEDAA